MQEFPVIKRTGVQSRWQPKSNTICGYFTNNSLLASSNGKAISGGCCPGWTKFSNLQWLKQHDMI